MIDRPPEDGPGALAWMNDRYATIIDAGRMCVIAQRITMMHRVVIDYTPVEHFKNAFFLDSYVTTGGTDDSPIKHIPLAAYWLRHKHRRHFPGGVIFDPTEQMSSAYFNLWSGFAPIAQQQQIDDPDASWHWLKNHILLNICQGDDEYYEYVINWMATGVQCLDRPAGVALVLRGDEGIGKGIFARAYGYLFGNHFLHLNDARQLTGTFNGHLEDAIVVFADEAIGTGDKAAVSKLKTLITEPTLHIEAKYRNPHTATNHIRVILASNEDWVVPAGKDARRYCVLDVGNAQRGSREYFSLITDQLTHGGYGAMLTELLTRDLSQFDITNIPQTIALLDQKLHSLTPDEQWWLDRLHDGRVIPGDAEWHQVNERKDIREAYREAMRSLARHEHSTISVAARVARVLARVLPDGYPANGGWAGHERKWVFPPLADCRAHFERLLGQAIQWEAAQEGDQE